MTDVAPNGSSPIDPNDGTVSVNGERIDIANDLRTPSLQTMIANRALPHRRVEAVEALEALVENDGDIVLAAMQLRTAPQAVLASVVGDQNGHDLLARYLRAYTMSKTFGLVNVLQGTLSDQLRDGELAAKDVARTLVGLIQGMASLTDTSAAPQVDPFAALMKILPADEREALAALVPSHSRRPGRDNGTAPQAPSADNNAEAAA